MQKYDASNAECLIFTYKEGLLSAVAHDLKLKVSDFTIEIDDQLQSIKGEFQTSSIQVVNAMHNNSEAPHALKPKDRKDIEKNMTKDVLHPKKYPLISFTSSSITKTDSQYKIIGKLDLHGTTKQISLYANQKNDQYIAEIQLDQRDFKIKPFSAMFGTLKIKPHILIKLSIPTK